MGDLSKSLIILMLLLALSTLIVASIPVGVAEGATRVSGNITSNMVWTKANSPYILEGPVTIDNGITLTVEAGAIVNLNSYSVQILGTLSARGTNDDFIQIKGLSGSEVYQIIFNQTSVAWSEYTNSGSIIENCIIDVASIFIDNASPKISHNSVGGANVLQDETVSTVIFVQGGSSIISNNTITASFKNSAIEIEGGSSTISGNSIINPYSVSTGIFIGGDNSALIYGNSIIGNEARRFSNGIWVRGGNPKIERNKIENNAIGMAIDGGSRPTPNVQNNTIIKNYRGFRFGNGFSTNSIIKFNNIEIGSSTWAEPKLVDLDSGFSGPTYTINAVENWWGIDDEKLVNKTVNEELVN
jgi:hypothetical protein